MGFKVSKHGHNDCMLKRWFGPVYMFRLIQKGNA